ncbi:MAG: hypothetical protein GXO77_06320 [Calditrichaeota bacterium]|nr:hypothetical protein [Calditrichota bacterium]
MIFAKKIFWIILLLAGMWGCKNTAEKTSVVNLEHLNYLYRNLDLTDGTTIAIIPIYAEYPDYKPVEAKGEGITCVDDIARAAIVYLRYSYYYSDASSLRKAENLMRSLLKMQAENGFFYNFISSEGEIEKTIPNSQPLPDWWTWRAFWALTEYLKISKPPQQGLSDSVRLAIGKVIPHISDLAKREGSWKEIEGFRLPEWLPLKHAADQAALIIKGLTNYYDTTKDRALLPLMRSFANGIIAVQINDDSLAVDGMFLSWKNYWHAYGNSQADALLDYFRVSGDSLALKAALKEIDRFYRYLYEKRYYRSFKLSRITGKVQIVEKKQFEQIAYDFRPMVWACLNAYEITKDEKYAVLAAQITSWFAGENLAKAKMYDPQTGRCFDGIVNPQKINLNSGAESTIEALLTLIEIEQNQVAKDLTHKYFKGETVIE